MKVAITGKGGVGKTSVAASLTRCWIQKGLKVVAVDADPDANLAGTLGHRGPEIRPLTGLKQLIEERVGGGEGWGGFLRMNPKVDDIPEKFGVKLDGARVLVMGTIERGRRGCACPENVMVREVLSHLLLEKDEHVVVDMEAGIEHLGRGTAEGVDLMLVVVEPGWASIQTAGRVARLASDLGIPRVEAIANRISNPDQAQYVRESLGEVSITGALPVDSGLEEDARVGRFDPDRPFHIAMKEIAQRVLAMKSRR